MAMALGTLEQPVGASFGCQCAVLCCVFAASWSDVKPWGFPNHPAAESMFLLTSVEDVRSAFREFKDSGNWTFGDLVQVVNSDPVFSPMARMDEEALARVYHGGAVEWWSLVLVQRFLLERGELGPSRRRCSGNEPWPQSQSPTRPALVHSAGPPRLSGLGSEGESRAAAQWGTGTGNAGGDPDRDVPNTLDGASLLTLRDVVHHAADTLSMFLANHMYSTTFHMNEAGFQMLMVKALVDVQENLSLDDMDIGVEVHVANSYADVVISSGDEMLIVEVKYVQVGYIHDASFFPGEKDLKWTPALERSGRSKRAFLNLRAEFVHSCALERLQSVVTRTRHPHRKDEKPQPYSIADQLHWAWSQVTDYRDRLRPAGPRAVDVLVVFGIGARVLVLAEADGDKADQLFDDLNPRPNVHR